MRVIPHKYVDGGVQWEQWQQRVAASMGVAVRSASSGAGIITTINLRYLFTRNVINFVSLCAPTSRICKMHSYIVNEIARPANT